jgi:proline iminopeptidase
MPTGVVKWFNPTKGYGFIKPDDGGSDLYVDFTALKEAQLLSLLEGDKVSYEPSQEPDKTGKHPVTSLALISREKQPEPSAMLLEDWKKTPYFSEYFPSGDLSKPKELYATNAPRAVSIPVGDGHVLHAQEYGNPQGEPVMFLHGGPGGGCGALDAAYFDPNRYRIILFDQRGCGLSTPTTTQDREAAMKGNNTGTLIEDMNKIRDKFGIKGKMHIEGGSWGSTLALAYATRYPQNVKSLQLRGVFLGTKPGLKFIFQGNAESYVEVPDPKTISNRDFLKAYYSQPMTEEGGYRAYTPQQDKEDGRIPNKLQEGQDFMKLAYAKGWDEFVRLIPKGERKDMIKAYDVRLLAKADSSLPFDPAHPEKSFKAFPSPRINPEYQYALGLAFAKWEGLISQFSQQVDANGNINLGKFAEPDFALDFARLEARYTRDGFYMGKHGLKTPVGKENMILDNLDKIAKFNIPILIAHGANDQVCPVRDATVLEKAYKTAQKNMLGDREPHAPVIMDIRNATGHTMRDRGNTLALIDLINNKTPEMTPDEKTSVGPGSVGNATQRILGQGAAGREIH